MKTIKQIRQLTGLNQTEFAKKYEIPLSTLQGWESKPESSRYRECSSYVLKLLERVVLNDLKKEK